MSLNLSRLEKEAVIKVLGDIMFADGVIAQGEKNYLMKLFKVLNVSEDIAASAARLSVTSALNILRKMTLENKQVVIMMMSEMINSDGDVDASELDVFAVVAIAMGADFTKVKNILI